MKKIFLILMALILTFAMVACTAENNAQNDDNNGEVVDVPGEENNNEVVDDTQNTDDTAAVTLDGDLKSVIDAVTKDIAPAELSVETISIDAELFPAFFPIEAPETFEAYVCAPLIGSIAHEVSVLRVADNDVATAVAEQLKENLDPRKWICVEAEKTIVEVRDNVILVVMSTADVADAALANFMAI
ncbi:MAG: hypothetical protein IJO74_06275 [Clostridia bacterium]|nr:hypothetical protein [Clostridia bacterium]